VSTTASVTIARLGVRSLFGRWRGVLNSLGLIVVVPLVALLATSGLLASEIDDGSISYLLAKPVSRYTIVASKLVVALACVLAFGAVPMGIAGLVLLPGSPSFGLGFAVGSLLGGAAYCALFSWLSVLTRHAVVIGLIYLLIWEGLLGGLLDGIRWLSVTRWSSEVVDRIADLELVDDLSLAYALIALAVVLALGVWGTARELQGFNLTGDE
jgi:ABC-2 type transport system permease protein